jgi:hypothetical protein
MRVTKTQLKRLIREEILYERMAPQMGKNTGGLSYMSDMDQEMINYIEKELGTSNFFDEVMERIPAKQRGQILASISREYGFEIGGIRRV